MASFNLNLAGNSFYWRSRTASDMTRFVYESRDFYEDKSGQRSCRRENGPGFRGSPEKAVQSRRKFLFVVFATSVYKQTAAYFRWQLSRPRKPADCDTVVWIQTWTRNVKICSKCVQTLHFERALHTIIIIIIKKMKEEKVMQFETLKNNNS